MIQRIPKFNIPATIAMCATFAVSIILVQVLRTTYVMPFCGMDVLPLASTSIPCVQARNQPGSPLTIGAIEKDEHTGSTSVTVRNTSGRTISAYCLAANYRDRKSIISQSSYSSDLNAPFIFGVNDTYIWDQNLNQGNEVWVDFVEFTDGTTWGPDTARTLERMNAIRMGSSQAALEYSWVLRTRGPQAMLASFPKPITNSMLDQYDERRRKAFDSGVESVCARLLGDKAYVDATMTSRSGKAYNAALTAQFKETLQSYIKFKRS
jgi:hypothetical protein